MGSKGAFARQNSAEILEPTINLAPVERQEAERQFTAFLPRH
jgi:hypothetical protein